MRMNRFMCLQLATPITLGFLKSVLRLKLLFSASPVLLGLLLVQLACSSSVKPQAGAPAEQLSPAAQASIAQSAQVDSSGKPWPEKMQSLSKTLSDLLPLVASKSKFNDVKNFDRIDVDTKSLSSLAHGLKAGAKPNNDPSMQVVSGLFAEDISRALESLHNGNREYARQILRDTSSYCVQCHTQTNNGPDFPRLNLSINTNELSLVEQAEFFAATRQFDRALDSYQKALADDNYAKKDPFGWEQAARVALAITVRVKADPNEAQKLVAKMGGHPGLSAATQEAITDWKTSINDWLKEKLPKPQTPKEILSRAEFLVQKAQKRQDFPLDHTQDVSFFRASGLLHDLLQSYRTRDETFARALYLAGIASEATRDMNFWTLHESYYEQCIRVLPHTKQAQQCFDRLNDSVTLGYSGSGGVRIPPDVAKRLDVFKTLASD
jgi:tetratricopeptide (TPR) repeat protein